MEINNFLFQGTRRFKNLEPEVERALKEGEKISLMGCAKLMRKYFFAGKWCGLCTERNLWNPANYLKDAKLPVKKFEDDPQHFEYSFILCNQCRVKLMDSFLA
jgi:hypothetical protein